MIQGIFMYLFNVREGQFSDLKIVCQIAVSNGSLRSIKITKFKTQVVEVT